MLPIFAGAAIPIHLARARPPASCLPALARASASPRGHSPAPPLLHLTRRACRSPPAPTPCRSAPLPGGPSGRAQVSVGAWPPALSPSYPAPVQALPPSPPPRPPSYFPGRYRAMYADTGTQPQLQ
jgi:hypothetical protein